MGVKEDVLDGMREAIEDYDYAKKDLENAKNYRALRHKKNHSWDRRSFGDLGNIVEQKSPGSYSGIKSDLISGMMKDLVMDNMDKYMDMIIQELEDRLAEATKELSKYGKIKR